MKYRLILLSLVIALVVFKYGPRDDKHDLSSHIDSEKISNMSFKKVSGSRTPSSIIKAIKEQTIQSAAAPNSGPIIHRYKNIPVMGDLEFYESLNNPDDELQFKNKKNDDEALLNLKTAMTKFNQNDDVQVESILDFIKIEDKKGLYVKHVRVTSKNKSGVIVGRFDAIINRENGAILESFNRILNENNLKKNNIITINQSENNGIKGISR